MKQENVLSNMNFIIKLFTSNIKLYVNYFIGSFTILFLFDYRVPSSGKPHDNSRSHSIQCQRTITPYCSKG